MKRLLFHVPLIGVLLIFAFFDLVDRGHFPGFRNESTYGWMVVVWYPLAALLALTQVILWIGWAVRRLRRR